LLDAELIERRPLFRERDRRSLTPSDDLRMFGRAAGFDRVATNRRLSFYPPHGSEELWK
jgi:hypothetical protein